MSRCWMIAAATAVVVLPMLVVPAIGAPVDAAPAALGVIGSAGDLKLASDPRDAGGGSRARPVRGKRLHGLGFFGNSRLGKIENGTVPCVHSETTAAARCVFSTRGKGSGSWLESDEGDHALIGQSISLTGQPGGEYVVGARIHPEGTVPALAPTGKDGAGVMAGSELPGTCITETWGTATNRTGYPMDNHATLEIHTNSASSTDGAVPIRSYPYTSPSGKTGTVYVYRGQGAGLNDPNGTERDENGRYLTNSHSCHMGISNGVLVYAAKRPATMGYPPKVDPLSPLVWRPVSGVRIAN